MVAQRPDGLTVTIVDDLQTSELPDSTTITVVDLRSNHHQTPKTAGGGRRLALSRAVVIGASAAVAILALWFILFAFVLTSLQERSTQARLYDRYRLELAQETAPLAEPVKVGSPVAMITFPSAGMHNLVVVEGTTSRLLQEGPGHQSSSPLPGQTGDAVLLGRSVTYDSPFGRIADVKAGAPLTITDGEGIFRYRVEDVRYQGDRLPPPLTAQQSRVTLVTAVGGGWENGWAPSHTVYLDAMMVKGQPQPVPTGLPTTVSNSSLPMQGDPSGLIPLIFWLEGLVAAVVILVWARARWGRPQTWIAGAPILFIALWGASNALMRFLPNLL